MNTTQKSPEIKLVGISVRTSTADQIANGTISATINRYLQENISGSINSKKAPGATYCVYTEYASNEYGDYTYFIGEEVTDFDNVPASLQSLSIPEQTYAKFTSEAGPMPDVCISLWQKIWALPDLAATRNYIADFEVYDARALDPLNTQLDIFVGIATD